MDKINQRKNLAKRRQSEKRHEKEIDQMLQDLPEQKKKEIPVQPIKEADKSKWDEIKALENELMELKNSLKIIDIEEIPLKDTLERLKAEVHNLEIHDIHLKSQKGRLEDKLDHAKRSYEEANRILEHAHLEALDREEMEYMAIQIENKKNDLLTSRNYVREMQKIGWSFLPPKVADECKKTQIELDYIHNQVKSIKDETEEAVVSLQKTEDDLIYAQNTYNDVQLYNTEIEKEIDVIVTEINKISSSMNVKESEAKELEEVAFHMKTKIEAAHKYQEELLQKSELEKEERLKEDAKRREEIKIRNKEVDDLKAEYAKLTETAKLMEEKLSIAQKKFREQKAEFQNVVRKKYTTEDIIQEIEDVKKENAAIIIETVKETKLKFMYYNIIEDMLGNLKILCRCRDCGSSNLKIIDDTLIKIKSSNDDLKYKFDYVFNEKSATIDVFERVEHLYDNASDGYNCYVVAMGEQKTGKTYTIIGEQNNGLMFIGLNKLKDLIKLNAKTHLTTRMFVCAVEIANNRIYDLQNNNTSNTYEVKKDYFGMTLVRNAKYSECFTDDEVRACYIKAVKNRPEAYENLGTKDTNFICTLTIQVYNKFHHRYCKGKITYVKMASLQKNKEIRDALDGLSKGKPMNYNMTTLTQVLRDCFGGSAKTCVIACINPSESSSKDTLSTMKLVSGMKAITNEISRNIESEEVFKIKNNIERLLRGQKQEYL